MILPCYNHIVPQMRGETPGECGDLGKYFMGLGFRMETRLIKALFNHGIKRNWFIFNPCHGIAPFGIEKRKKYIPTFEDIEKVISLAKEEQRNYLLVVALTMARPKFPL